MSPNLLAKLTAARKSLTVWFAAAIPVALSAALTAQEHLTDLGLTGWRIVALSVVVSAIVAFLRVRAVKAATPGAPE